MRDGDFRKDRAAFRIEIGNEGWNFPIGYPYTTTVDFVSGSNVSQLNPQNQTLSGSDLTNTLNDIFTRQFRFGFLVEQDASGLRISCRCRRPRPITSACRGRRSTTASLSTRSTVCSPRRRPRRKSSRRWARRSTRRRLLRTIRARRQRRASRTAASSITARATWSARIAMGTDKTQVGRRSEPALVGSPEPVPHRQRRVPDGRDREPDAHPCGAVADGGERDPDDGPEIVRAYRPGARRTRSATPD